MAKGKFGGMGGMNMGAMIKQAQKMQNDMAKLQDEIAVMETTATAGGGAVTAVVVGTTTVKSLTLKPEVVDPDDIEMLQDLIVAAVNEVIRQVEEDASAAMGKMTGGMGGFPF